MIGGYVLWEGPSRIDGTPIVAVATMKTSNRKTGNMVQTWILRQDMPPQEAVRSGEDAAICGTCPLRAGKGCYVRTEQAPLSVWKTWRAGKYPHLDASGLESMRGRKVRLGAYGDPAAVPMGVWRRLTRAAKGWTGYSHQWARFGSVASLCMASTSSESETRAAWGKGMRTFRARPEGAPLLPGEIECPNTTHGISCEDCGLCMGTFRRAVNISIVAHGARAGLID